MATKYIQLIDVPGGFYLNINGESIQVVFYGVKEDYSLDALCSRKEGGYISAKDLKAGVKNKRSRCTKSY